jgi:hypothetical protein
VDEKHPKTSTLDAKHATTLSSRRNTYFLKGANKYLGLNSKFLKIHSSVSLFYINNINTLLTMGFSLSPFLLFSRVLGGWGFLF